jgi:hypothetical protein
MRRLPDSLGKWIAEILIVFIGITLAFFVENYRTDLEETKSLRQHLRAINNDLIQDSIKFEWFIYESKIKVNRIDSLIELIELKNDMRDKLLTISYIQIFHFIDVNDIAFQTFKSSGDYALLEDNELRDALSGYYKAQDFIKFQSNQHFISVNNELFKFTDNYLHPNDKKFNSHWHPKSPFDNWIESPPKYKSKTDKFDDIVVLNYANRCRDYFFYMSGSIENSDVLNNKSLRQKIENLIKE